MRPSLEAEGRGIGMHRSKRKTNPSTREACGHVAIKERMRRHKHMNSQTIGEGQRRAASLASRRLCPLAMSPLGSKVM